MRFCVLRVVTSHTCAWPWTKSFVAENVEAWKMRPTERKWCLFTDKLEHVAGCAYSVICIHKYARNERKIEFQWILFFLRRFAAFIPLHQQTILRHYLPRFLFASNGNVFHVCDAAFNMCIWIWNGFALCLMWVCAIWMRDLDAERRCCHRRHHRCVSKAFWH